MAVVDTYNVVFIGDVHIKHSNLEDIEVLKQNIIQQATSSIRIDCIIFGGDILDKHEKIDTQLLNKAYELIKTTRDIAHTYILVGNHDMINNQQFLTDAHWMNGMKEWCNVTVVDKPTKVYVESISKTFIMCPYVFPGRFVEALDTLECNWKDEAECIFAHQEFRGCKLGAIISEVGDLWQPDWPTVISGHIHERQTIQNNIIYPGSVLTHAFGSSSSHQGYSIFSFFKNGCGDGNLSENDKKFTEQQIELDLIGKKTIYKQIGDPISSKDLIPSNRFNMSGSIEEIAKFKHTIQFKEMKSSGVKVVFKIIDDKAAKANNTKVKRFTDILREKIATYADADLTNDYLSCL